jgi:hypothetical protein
MCAGLPHLAGVPRQIREGNVPQRNVGGERVIAEHAPHSRARADLGPGDDAVYGGVCEMCQPVDQGQVFAVKGYSALKKAKI